MSNDKLTGGISILCSERGVVMKIIRDQLGIAQYIKPGNSFTDIVDDAAATKARHLLADTRAQGATFNWELNVVIGAEIVLMYFNGSTVADGLLLVGATSPDDLIEHFYSELMKINNEQMNMMRAALKEQAISEKMYHDIARLNNELTNTQRELAKKNAELQAQREWLRVTLSSIGDAVIATDKAGRVTFMNLVAEKLTGWQQDEAAGKSLGDIFVIINEKTRAPVRSPLEGMSGDSEIVFLADNTALITKDGREVPIDDSAAPLVDDKGNFRGVVLVFRDVTERKRAAQALETERQRLFALLDGLPAYVHLLDADYNIRYTNRYFREQFGAPNGKPCYEVIHECTEPCGDCAPRHVLDSGVPGEWQWTRDDGRTYRVYDYPFTDVDGTRVVLELGIDITERNRAMEALRESEQRYRILAEAAEDYITIADRDGVFHYVNEVTARGFGMPRDEVIGRSIYELFSEDKAREVHQRIQQVFESGNSISTEEFSGIPGSMRWVDTKGIPLKDKWGNVDAVMSVSRDITAYKRTAQALQASEAKYRHIIEENADGMIVLDREGDVLFVNAAAEKFFGRAADELVGEALGIPAIVGEASRMEVIRPGQEIRIAEVHTVETEWESEFAYLVTLRDVTARENAEEELRESREWFRNIVENASEIIYTLTANGAFTFVSPTWKQILGHDVDEVKGRGFADFVHPDDIPVCRSFLEEVMATGHSREDVEYRVRHKDGSWRWHRSTGAAVNDEDGAPLYYVGIAQDVTERKQAAEELARTNEELKQFSYAISHDLREPLRMVTSYMKLLERRYKDKLDDDAREFIYFAVDGAERMDGLIKALLSYSRVDTRGKEFAPTDCEEILERTLRDLRFAIEENDAVVTHDPLPTVLADATQLGQLFQNLIGNALKYRGEEPPRVHLSASPSPQRGEGEWLFAVRDNGIGIDEKHFKRIFVIFQRLHARGEYEGTGIGLATCKKIVERHGGRIWVESQPGAGSTFYFTLLAVEEMAE